MPREAKKWHNLGVGSVHQNNGQELQRISVQTMIEWGESHFHEGTMQPLHHGDDPIIAGTPRATAQSW